MSHPLLRVAIPKLADELRTLLEKDGELQLAGQVSSLRIVNRCSCGEDSCATFYTVPKPDGSWGVGHRNVMLPSERGFLILDVVREDITCVEVLDRDEIREKLGRLLP